MDQIRRTINHILCVVGLLLMGVQPTSATATRTVDDGLVGYWKLAGDFKDYSGKENHGLNHGADFYGSSRNGKMHTGAHFDGIADYIEVADSPSLNLAGSDFSISLWVKTDKSLKDTLGDIITKYEPTARRGLNFTIMNYAGVPTCQPNYRNVLFGIDNGIIQSPWTDCGRLGNAVMVGAFAVYRGQLYAGTFEWGADESCHVYRYAGNQNWIDCGSPDKCTAIFAMAVYEGELYVGSSRYDGTGSALKPSPNTNPGGKVYRYQGGKKWTCCGKLSNPETGHADTVMGLTVFDGRLYATPLYPPGKGLYRYEGGQNWTYCGRYRDDRVVNTTAFNGSLYAASYDHGGIFRYDGGRSFTSCGKPENVTQTYSFTAYQGQMYAGTWPNAEVFRYDGGSKWTNCGQLGDEKEVMGMLVYNGKLYAGTLPSAKVYRYEGGTEWIDASGQLDPTADDRPYNANERWMYRRAWTMAVYNGRLYCGLLPSGEVKSMEAGKSVTYDFELTSGWRHLVAVRNGNKLELYIDGTLAATSSEFNPIDYDISNDQPLRIGFGQHDYFNGSISQVRIYNRALSVNEVKALYTMK